MSTGQFNSSFKMIQREYSPFLVKKKNLRGSLGNNEIEPKVIIHFHCWLTDWLNGIELIHLPYSTPFEQIVDQERERIFSWTYWNEWALLAGTSKQTLEGLNLKLKEFVQLVIETQN